MTFRHKPTPRRGAGSATRSLSPFLSTHGASRLSACGRTAPRDATRPVFTGCRAGRRRTIGSPSRSRSRSASAAGRRGHDADARSRRGARARLLPDGGAPADRRAAAGRPRGEHRRRRRARRRPRSRPAVVLHLVVLRRLREGRARGGRRRGAPGREPSSPSPFDVVAALPDRLREAQATFALTGGLHATGLFTADGSSSASVRTSAATTRWTRCSAGRSARASCRSPSRSSASAVGSPSSSSRRPRRRLPGPRRRRCAVVARRRAGGRPRRHARGLRPRRPWHRVHRATADRRVTHLTGVLLVGGASERFGAPKALARFRGETLAERAQRLLAEACDEVLVVGKRADGLPFDVLDDGTSSRAPVHGVIAGLRGARHDVAVVLPVDVPLMTPGALRALGDAAAVPSARIPLPGAYPRALLPVLEAAGRGGRALAPRRQPGHARAARRPAARRRHARGAARARAARSRARRRRHGNAGRARPRGARGSRPCRDLHRAPRRRSRRRRPRRPVDYRDPIGSRGRSRRAREARGPIELAVCWIHTDGPEAPRIVADALAPGARLVQVFGTRVWPLADVPLHVAYRQVLLGSTAGRWLTHEEISAGAAASTRALVVTPTGR